MQKNDKRRSKKILIDISFTLGTVGAEQLTLKDGEKMREAIETLDQQSILDKIKEDLI